MSPEYWVQESSVLNVTLWSLKDLEADLAMQASVATLFTPVSEVAPFMLAGSPAMTSTAQAHSGHFLPAPQRGAMNATPLWNIPYSHGRQ